MMAGSSATGVVSPPAGEGPLLRAERLRKHFEVDRNSIAIAALRALADEGKVDKATLSKAMKNLAIDPAKPDPWKI